MSLALQWIWSYTGFLIPPAPFSFRPRRSGFADRAPGVLGRKVGSSMNSIRLIPAPLFRTGAAGWSRVLRFELVRNDEAPLSIFSLAAHGR
jgi:hypothetical protein